MVEFTEGLRAPRIGQSLATGARALAPGRAAIAMGAAAIISGTAATAVGTTGATFQNSYTSVPYAPPTRFVEPPTALSANPFIGPSQGAKAPSLGGRAVAGAGAGGGLIGAAKRALSSASSGLDAGAARLERGLLASDNGLAKIAPRLAPLKGLAGPLGNLATIADFAAGDPLADEAGQLAKAQSDALSRKQAERNKQQRKGDTSAPRTKPDQRPKTVGQFGVQYRVLATAQFKNGPPLNFDNIFTGPISGVVKASANGIDNYSVYSRDSQGGSLQNGYISGGKDFIEKPLTISSITRVDGTVDPIGEPLPPEFFADGSPLVADLTPNPTNSSTPTVPGTSARQPNPANTAPTEPVRPAGTDQPREGFKNPSAPDAPQPNLNDPSPLQPTLDGTQAGLPSIPSAPSSGSASLAAPSFPSSFSQVPGQRNPDALKPIEPIRPEAPKPGGCADPCIATLQGQQANSLDALQGLAELLNQLLNALQQQGEEEEDQNELTDISVPVCNCNKDGSPEFTQIDLRVPASLATSTLEQFTSISNVQALLCKVQRHTERSHNILGGDVWFKTPDSRAPTYKTKIERKIKELGPLFDFPSLPDEDPIAVAAEEEQARRTGIPPTGQISVNSMLGLINAYSSTLYHRAGFHGFPAEVPQTLLGYSDAEPLVPVKDMASYFVWFVGQVDALIGKFPINITIEDVDPLTEGNQTKEIELPNISEALAEMYGINIATSVNADVTVNFLMRLASELIATKNSTLITQDYVRANAAFLGYKGNPARREVNYSFNPAKLDSLDEFLKESKGYLVGWEEDDRESVVGFLQRIVFSSGIIKAAFFRDKKRLLELQKEIESMMTGDKVASDAEWTELLRLLNDETGYFNTDSIPHPRVRNKPAPPPGTPPENPSPGPTA